MKRALILQHMLHDNAGRFLDFFAEDGVHPDTVRLWEGEAIPDLKPYDLLLVLGGAMDVWQEAEHPWLVDEKQAIREWVGERARPYLGLCLGHQLLADAMGGKVALAEKREVGVHAVTINDHGMHHPLFASLTGTHPVMQWHLAEVTQPPPGAQVLASSSATKVQAIAVGDHALGLQFHAEFTPQTVASWASIPDYIAGLDRNLGPGAYDRVTREAYPLMPRMGAMTRRIYDNLMRATGLKKAA
ncbi:MAG: type 1 glutamine amidotransferase [Rhizobiales bacterium]|nr:type 1 glutamine amidotransferase [Hyphomicrobiales bacterium]